MRTFRSPLELWPDVPSWRRAIRLRLPFRLEVWFARTSLTPAECSVVAQLERDLRELHECRLPIRFPLDRYETKRAKQIVAVALEAQPASFYMRIRREGDEIVGRIADSPGPHPRRRPLPPTKT